MGSVRNTTLHNISPRLSRAVAIVLLLTLTIFTGTVFTTQNTAHAAPIAVIGVGAAAALPVGAISGGVGIGVGTLSAGAALAGTSIVAASVLAGNWAVEALFSWGDDTPEDFGDPPSTGHVGNTTGGYLASSTWKSTSPIGWEATASWSVTPSAGDSSYKMTMMVVARKSDGTCVSGPHASGNCSSQTSSTRELRSYPAKTVTLTTNTTSSLASSATSGTLLVFCQTAATSCMNTTTWTPVSGAEVVHADKMGNITTQNSTAPSGEVGSTPLTMTPQTCYQADVVECINGQPVFATRNSDFAPITFPAAPAGTTIVSRSAPITRTSDGTVLGDGLTGETGTSTPWEPDPVPAEYPDCANRLCVMTLTETSPDGRTQTCNSSYPCLQYAAVAQQYPEVGTSAPTVARYAPDGSSYQCKFGPYAVAVAECTVIPGVGIVPATQSANCLGGIGWNPTTWVTVPVKCALEWAFVPDAATMTGWQNRIDTLKTKGPFPFLDDITGWVGDLFDTADNAQSCTADSGVGPIRWCEAIDGAGDWAENSVWGQGIVIIQKIVLTMLFAFYWYNRITASAGSKAEA